MRIALGPSGTLSSVEKSGAPLRPHEHQAFIRDNPAQPSGEFGFPMKLIQVFECLYECILCLVLSISVVTEIVVPHIHTLPPMALEQCPQRPPDLPLGRVLEAANQYD
jgi:hypothetical protein